MKAHFCVLKKALVPIKTQHRRYISVTFMYENNLKQAPFYT